MEFNECLVGVARHPDGQAIERGVELLMGKQQPNGDWPQVILRAYSPSTVTRSLIVRDSRVTFPPSAGEHCRRVQQELCYQLHFLQKRLPHLDPGPLLKSVPPQSFSWEGQAVKASEVHLKQPSDKPCRLSEASTGPQSLKTVFSAAFLPQTFHFFHSFTSRRNPPEATLNICCSHLLYS